MKISQAPGVIYFSHNKTYTFYLVHYIRQKVYVFMVMWVKGDWRAKSYPLYVKLSTACNPKIILILHFKSAMIRQSVEVTICLWVFVVNTRKRIAYFFFYIKRVAACPLHFSLLLLVCKTHARIQLFFQREGVRRIISFSIGGSRPIFGNITMRI